MIKEENIKRYPTVEEIILQRDNAPCFASRVHIRNVHMLNKQGGPKSLDGFIRNPDLVRRH